MASTKLGSKRICESCGTKYYDFGKPEPTCPSCGAKPGEGGDGS